MNLLDMFYYSFTLNMITIPLIIIFVIFVGKPLFVFLKAKLMGRTMLLVARKDRRLDFIVGKSEGGMIRTKKYGDFMVIPQTAYLTTTGVSCGLVYEPYGVTLPQEFIDSTTVLRNHGINTYSDMEALTNPNPNPKKLKVIGIAESKESKKFSENERKKLLANQRVTRAIDNVTNFFKYNINPNTIRATINRSVSEVIQQYHKTDWMKIAMFALLIMIGGALAYYIITSAGGGGGVVQSVAETVGETTKVTTGTTIK